MKKLLMSMCLLGSFSAFAADCKDGLDQKFASAQKELAQLGMEMIQARNWSIKSSELPVDADTHWVTVKYTLNNGVVLRLQSLLSPYQTNTYGSFGEFSGFKCALTTEKNNLVWLVNDETNIKIDYARFNSAHNWFVPSP